MRSVLIILCLITAFFLMGVSAFPALAMMTPIGGGEAEVEDQNGEGEGEQQEEGQCVDYRPVLLVHGFNSDPGMWKAGDSSMEAWFKRAGYAPEMIGLYRYHGFDEGAYNNQGSVMEVSTGMRQAIMGLSFASVACGGTGLVDVIAHSMGGLVARQYLLEWVDDHRIYSLTSVGAPYMGSWVLDYYRDLGYWEKSLVNEVSQAIIGADMSSGAIKDLHPDSDYLREAGSLPVGHNVWVNTMYGDAQVGIYVSLFRMKLEVSRIDWIGDGVVSVESATGFVSESSAAVRVMGYTASVEVEASIGRGLLGVWQYGLDIDNQLGDVLHNALVDNMALRRDLLNILRGGNTENEAS